MKFQKNWWISRKKKCEVQSKFFFGGKYSLIEVLLKLMNLHGHSKGFH
jgi:hypothetical protein